MALLSELLPSFQELEQVCPLTRQEKDFIVSARQRLLSILAGLQPQKVLIVGPCSIDHKEAALEYGRRLKQLAKTIESKFFVIMRVHLDKPRTQHGWRGFLHDPSGDGSCLVQEGLFASRKLLKELAAMEVPAASEILDPYLSHYLEDLLTWGGVGARTVTSQPHRQLAAYMPFPVGFKNPLEGPLHSAVHAMKAASLPQFLVGPNKEGRLCRLQAKGNRAPHLILRGTCSSPNYSQEHIKEAKQLLVEADLPPFVFIDCAHGNSQKNHLRQCDVFKEVVHHPDVRGILLESYLQEGNQEFPCRFGCSLTDPCLSWEQTETLLT